MSNISSYDDFSVLFDKMRDNIDFYERLNKSQENIKIRLADGNNICFCVPRYCVSHLLGVNVDYLSSTSFFNAKNSYSLLKCMLDNEFRICDSINRGILNYNDLFSKYVVNKVDNFKNNIMVDVENSELVCEYNKERAYIDSDFSFDFDYVLTKKIADSYSLLGLKNTGSSYVPITSQFFASKDLLDEKLSKIIKNQKITYVNGVYFSNGKKFFLYDELKLGKVGALNKYSKMGAILDVSGDFLHCLEHSNSVRNRGGQIDYNVARTIIEYLDNGKVIEAESLGFSNFDRMDSNLGAVIAKINDLILKKTDFEGKSDFSFSELLDLREKCGNYRERIGALESRNDNLTVELEEKNNTISILNAENAELTGAIDDAVKVLSRKI